MNAPVFSIFRINSGNFHRKHKTGVESSFIVGSYTLLSEKALFRRFNFCFNSLKPARMSEISVPITKTPLSSAHLSNSSGTIFLDTAREYLEWICKACDKLH